MEFNQSAIDPAIAAQERAAIADDKLDSVFARGAGAVYLDLAQSEIEKRDAEFAAAVPTTAEGAAVKLEYVARSLAVCASGDMLTEKGAAELLAHVNAVVAGVRAGLAP